MPVTVDRVHIRHRDQRMPRTTSKRLVSFLARVIVTVAVIGATVVVARTLAFNPTTLGFILLVVVLVVSAWNGTAIGVGAAILATALFNFFFLPPVGTWRIDDLENWLSLASFLVVSVVVSQLVVRARREAESAKRRREEAESLYRLGVELSGLTNRADALEATIRLAMEASEARNGGLILFDGSPYRQKPRVWFGPLDDGIEDVVAGVGRHRRSLEFTTIGARDVYLPLVLGGRSTGVLVLRDPTGDLGMLESMASLVATAVERDRFIRENAHIVALEESEALKTSLLRAISHDLATPVTALALNVGRIRRHLEDKTDAETAMRALEDEATRLQRRITGLLSSARLEAGALTLNAEPAPVADLVRAAREHLPTLRDRRIDVRVDSDCPDVWVDPPIAAEILVNLIENADRSSPVGETIEIVAAAGPANSRVVRIEVCDRGPGVAAVGPHNGGELEVNDVARRGLGLEIATGLASASGGTVLILDREGGGAIVRLDLPAAHTTVVESVP